jgi:myo-inositol-1(or 4)-monophosphatase
MPSLQELTRIALDVATEAGKLVLTGWGRRPAFEKKRPKDLVTEFDVRSEQLIVDSLAERTVLPVMAEERGGTIEPGLSWCCDPLDGTTNFVHGHPVWSVSIGLLRDGWPVAGAVVAPALGMAWHGYEGGGAWRNGAPCTVSATQRLDETFAATGFPYAEREREPTSNFSSFIRVKRAIQAVRRCGSAAVDCCWVADGTYDAYWERTMRPWDVAAGIAVALAAGGRLACLDGTGSWTEGSILLSNGRVHDALAALIEGRG